MVVLKVVNDTSSYVRVFRATQRQSSVRIIAIVSERKEKKQKRISETFELFRSDIENVISFLKLHSLIALR